MMRKFIVGTLLYSSLVQIPIGCLSDDRRDDIFIEAPDLVEIRDQENLFSVNDTLWIINTTSRYLPMVENAPNPLDIFETTGSPSLEYSIRLERENGEGVYILYPIDAANVVSEVGDVALTYDTSIIATLNELENVYENVTGIVLRESGAYTLNVSEFNTYQSTTTFFVSIKTNIQNADENGYQFTVID